MTRSLGPLLGTQETWAEFLALPLTPCVTLDELLNHFKPFLLISLAPLYKEPHTKKQWGIEEGPGQPPVITCSCPGESFGVLSALSRASSQLQPWQRLCPSKALIPLSSRSWVKSWHSREEAKSCLDPVGKVGIQNKYFRMFNEALLACSLALECTGAQHSGGDFLLGTSKLGQVK